MRAEQVRRGFRRTGVTLFSLFAVLSLACISYGAYGYIRGPVAYCPDTAQPISISTADGLDAFTAQCKALYLASRGLDEQWSDFILNDPPSAKRHGDAFASGTAAWRDITFWTSLVSGILLSCGGLLLIFTEALSWIVRGFMRE